MRYGTSVDNKRLSSASNSGKDTSPRKARADKYSAKIVTSGGQKKPITGDESPGSRNRSKTIRGSLAGLNNPNSNHIQANGSGYDNKNIQTKRYDRNHYNIDNFENVNMNFNNSSNYSIMDNYSSTSMEKSSSNLINSRVKSNMSFR